MWIRDVVFILISISRCLAEVDLEDSYEREEIMIGYITGSRRKPGDEVYRRPGMTISGAISLAVEEINTRMPLVGGRTLNFTVAETYGDEFDSIYQTALLWKDNIHVYIGPQETCEHEGKMAAAFNLPMISYYCTDEQLSDKESFPTFARTRAPNSQISKSVTSVLLHFKWKTITFLYNNVDGSPYPEVAKSIQSSLEQNGIKIKFLLDWRDVTSIVYDTKINIFSSILENTYKESRIYLILGDYYEHVRLMVAMEEMGLFKNGEYFVVGADLSPYQHESPENYLRPFFLVEDNRHGNPTTQSAFRNFIGVVQSAPKSSFENFTSDVFIYNQKPPFSFENPLHMINSRGKIGIESACLYDAVHLYAKALNETLKEGTDPRNGTEVMKHIFQTTYKSALGFMMNIDENGDAEGNYTLIAIKEHKELADQYGLYPAGTFTLNETHTDLPFLHLFDEVDLFNGRGPPLAEPPCGFFEEKCLSDTGKIAGGVAGGVTFILLVICLIAYRNWHYEQELDSLIWKIDAKDIQIKEFTPYASEGPSKLQRAILPLMRASQMSLSSNPEWEMRYASAHTQLGMYKGRVFAIKRIRRRNVEITRNMKKELKLVRDMHHDNLNPFIGACVDPPYFSLLTEYCTRGSLKDVLENEDVKLDRMFIASLVGDIIRGVIYLHESPLKFHGNLKTSNCLVDSRWVLKLSDFGFHEVLSDAEGGNEDYTDNEKKAESLLYRAPELLRGADGKERGSQKGDAYSFGIILYEIQGRRGPFGPIDMTAMEIIDRVTTVENNNVPFRPQLEYLDKSYDFVRTALKECWAENPEERPDFKVIRTKLRPLRKGMKPNIFDNMLAMMEKYANNLEQLVDERTDQLIEEKKKTEALLDEMLPRYVADQLKQGNKVEAESFDVVTIYFSDIVGFTSMSAESTALEVIDFLNDLYTCFDSTIQGYDVYKVETIGDAYMVVSGLPIRNGDLHASEVASMSLQLLETIKKFKIRHRPTETLKLRIGLHSGAVCAGVVGVKMPRYCLFGDTVNTASRMESNGLPLKIHCSSACKELLDKLGGYILEYRGKTPMKGKGEMDTYWLLGEDEQRSFLQKQKRLIRMASSGKLITLNSDKSGSTRRASLKKSLSNHSNDPSKKLRFANSGSDSDHLNSDQSRDNSAHNINTVSTEAVIEIGEKRYSYPCVATIDNGRCHSRSNSPCEQKSSQWTEYGAPPSYNNAVRKESGYSTRADSSNNLSIPKGESDLYGSLSQTLSLEQSIPTEDKPLLLDYPDIDNDSDNVSASLSPM